MQRTLLALAAAFTAMLALSAGPAYAKTWVVDTTNPAIECPNADYTTITAAVAAPTTLPGDTIRVCPGLYSETVTVAKADLKLKGKNKPHVDCFDPLLPAADPTRDSIVDGVAFSFSLVANGIELEGFVVQGALTGITTSPSFSGYDVRENLIRSNTTFGINHNSSGVRESRVRKNCIRQNGEGHASETPGNLRNAEIEHNDTFRNGAGIDASGVGTRANVTMEHNTSRQDFYGFLISHSTGSSIDHNDVADATGYGIAIAGENVGLDVEHNRIRTSARGIRTGQALSFPPFPGPSSAIDVSHNDVSGTPTLSGILLLTGSVVASVFSHNESNENFLDGINVQSGNTGLMFEHNQTDSNGQNGIYSLSTGNTYRHNHMFHNTLFDARDDFRTFNTWEDNKCDTDSPPGTICE